MLLAGLSFLLALGPHSDSLSSSEVLIAGHEAHVRVLVQLPSLEEVLPGLDANGDGVIDRGEFAARADEARDYLEQHYRLWVDVSRELEGGRVLEHLGTTVEWIPPQARLALGELDGGAQLRFYVSSEEPIRDLVLEVTLFHTTSPGHVDQATVIWQGGAREGFGLTSETPRVRSDPNGRGIFGVYLGLGFDQFLFGWDQLAFVILLFLGARGLRSLLGRVMAYTAAHSATLALASLGYIDVSAHGNLIELFIAVSIITLALENLRSTDGLRPLWPAVLGLGLVHGLGLAESLARPLIGEHSRGWALFSFNLGIELGQLLVVLALLLVLGPWLLRWREREEAEGRGAPLVPRALRVAASVPLALLALWWFVQPV